MRKGKIRDVHDRDMDKPGQKHVIIERDNTGIDPLHDWDQVFYLHSNVPRHFRGNECDKSYPGDPMVEIEDVDGFGTGRYKPRDGVILFPVSAYIHSGIALSLGTIREFSCDPGGWDTTPNAAWLWTDRERWESLCGDWMEVYDESEKKRRPAKDWDEFVGFARSIAKSELEILQKCWDGEVFGYRTETSYVPYKRLYEDGSTEDEVDWEDGDDSCWGYVVDKVDDIDFPRGDGWEVFDATGRFVGDEYDIPEAEIDAI